MLLPDGVYTTFRTYPNLGVLGLTAHLQRLIDSHRLEQDGRPFDLTAIRHALRQVLQTESLPIARLRITTPYRQPDVYISIEPFTPYPDDHYSRGVACATVSLSRRTPRAKDTRFIAPSRSLKAGVPVHELIRVSADGQLLEGISSNFFVVKEGVLRTAADEVLLGITRTAVLACASGLLPVVEQAVSVGEIGSLEEAFITSASREVMPVISIDGRAIGNGLPGRMTSQLLTRYRRYVADHAEPI